MILVAFNPEYVNYEDVVKFMSSQELDDIKEHIVTVCHRSKTALPIYISDGRIGEVRNETNLRNNNET